MYPFCSFLQAGVPAGKKHIHPGGEHDPSAYTSSAAVIMARNCRGSRNDFFLSRICAGGHNAHDCIR